MTVPKKPPKVFISYAHEPDNPAHTDRVLALGDRLRSEGVEAILDLYQPNPKEGWPLWMIRQIAACDYVIMVCTPTYYRRVLGQEQPGIGRGVRWEGNLIFGALYKNGAIDSRFLPVLYPPTDDSCIPDPLQGSTYYYLYNGYEALYRHVTDQPEIVPRVIGSIVPLPPGARATEFPLEQETPLPSPKVSTAVNLPLPNPYFTGREEDLSRLGRWLKEQRRVSLHGLPGIGKTQIASEYANRHKAEYSWVFWVNAATQDSLFSGFAAIARQLNLSQQSEQDKQAVVQAVKAWMGHNSDWLLVLDNADDHALIISFLSGDNDYSEDIFPGGREGYLLLTTRWKFPGSFRPFKQTAVNEMPDKQGVELLLRYADIAPDGQSVATVAQADRDAAFALWQELTGHPLALAQAGAFILETDSTPSEYLHLYETEGDKLRDGTSPNSGFNSLKTTFNLAFEKVAQASPASAELLCLCAFLAPDAIPEELFVRGGVDLGEILNRVNTGLDWIEVLTIAQQYSLLSRNPQAKTVSMHRLVRDVLRDVMPLDRRKVWAERATRAVAKAFPAVEFENWALCDRLIPHALVCKKYIVEYNLRFPEAAKMLHEAAYFLSERGQHDRALPLYELSLSIDKAVFGEVHPAVAKCLNNMGWLYLNRARSVTPNEDYRRAEHCCRRALVIWRKIHSGMDHHEVAWCLHNLAAVHVAQERYEQAYLMFRKSVFIYEALWEQLRESEPLKYCNIAFSLEGLAEVCCQRAFHLAGDDIFRQAYLQEAEAHYQRASEIRHKHYPSPPGHPHLALSYIGLSMLYYGRNDFDKAISWLETAVRMLETVVPPLDKDPNLRKQRYILLNWYQKHNKDAEAAHLYAALIKDAVDKIDQEMLVPAP